MSASATAPPTAPPTIVPVVDFRVLIGDERGAAEVVADGVDRVRVEDPLVEIGVEVVETKAEVEGYDDECWFETRIETYFEKDRRNDTHTQWHFLWQLSN